MRYKRWSDEQIEEHKKAGKILTEIIFRAFSFIKKRAKRGVNEKNVESFIFREFAKNGLKTNGKRLIVAFNESAAEPHYNPAIKPQMLRKESIILIDIWGRLKKRGSPYSDITWMGYYGRSFTGEMKKVFNIVFNARNKAVFFLREELKKGKIPLGRDIDRVCRNYIRKREYGKKFIHTTGHSIGFRSPHGKYSSLGPKRRAAKKILKKIGYTIEPGIYLKDKFGVRTEIDFYINEKKEMIVTTSVQKDIVLI